MITFYEKTALTGGTGTSLDGIDGAVLNDGDVCLVQYGGSFYEYLMTASGYTTDAPYVITPVTNPGTKRWVLQAPYQFSFTDYKTGLTYQLTALQALITGAPSITLTIPGTYLILANLQTEFVAATFAADRLVTYNLYRTNNTPGDIADALIAWKVPLITTLTHTAGKHSLPPIIYTTANLTDILTLYGGIDVVPSAGSIQVSAAEIVAVRIR